MCIRDRRNSDDGLIPLVGVQTASGHTGLVTAFKFRGSGLDDFIVTNGVADVVLTGVAATTYTSRQTHTATQGQTVFTASSTLPTYIQVFVNGIKLRPTSDFTKSGTLSINSVGVCTFTKVNTDQLEAVNSNVTGISTVDGNFYLTGALLDSSGDTGTSGQILASTGSGTNWIAANTTSVANAINVGVNEVSDDAEKFVSFFSGNSGNLPNQVDAGIKYNPSTNLLTTTVTTAQVAQNLTGTPTISVNAITASGSVTASSFIGCLLYTSDAADE